MGSRFFRSGASYSFRDKKTEFAAPAYGLAKRNVIRTGK